MAEIAFVCHPDYLLHDTGQHPERAARLEVVADAVRSAAMPFLRWVTPGPASIEQVTRVHWPAYLDYLDRLCKGGGGMPDRDTVVAPESYRVALLGAGGAITGLELVARRDAEATFVAVRPPGHHAGPGSAAGFCLVNNVAVAAAHALSALGMERVLIVDFDAHHGNGTQAIFEEDPRVLFLSIHEYPFYPGTGPLRDVGRGAGRGYTVNVPIPAGAGDNAYAAIFEKVVEPVARAYRPDIILASAGFDGHWLDPLVLLELTTTGFASMTERLVDLADELCERRLVLVLEGGYDLEALATSVVATLAVLGGAEVSDPLGPPRRRHPVDVEPTIAEVRRAHPWWFTALAR